MRPTPARIPVRPRHIRTVKKLETDTQNFSDSCNSWSWSGGWWSGGSDEGSSTGRCRGDRPCAADNRNALVVDVDFIGGTDAEAVLTNRAALTL